jgi:hypothetical protein
MLTLKPNSDADLKDSYLVYFEGKGPQCSNVAKLEAAKAAFRAAWEKMA